MPDRDRILKRSGSPEDRLLISKILDKAELSGRIGRTAHTDFLDPRQQSLVRDYLGSLMGLGIKREKIGDIIVKDEDCSIVVLSDIAGYIAGNLSKVGNTGVGIEVGGTGGLTVPEPKVREIKVTVASLRLDSIAAPGFGISRSKAAEFIKAGRLYHNWVATENPDKPVREGDVLSIRGRGRVVIESAGGRTKRDRIGVVLKKLV